MLSIPFKLKVSIRPHIQSRSSGNNRRSLTRSGSSNPWRRSRSGSSRLNRSGSNRPRRSGSSLPSLSGSNSRPNKSGSSKRAWTRQYRTSRPSSRSESKTRGMSSSATVAAISRSRRRRRVRDRVQATRGSQSRQPSLPKKCRGPKVTSRIPCRCWSPFNISCSRSGRRE